MGLPPGIGSVALIDMLVRDQTPRPVVNECIWKIDKLLGAHFDKELHRLNNFHSYKVFAHQHETDLVPVVRIALMLKPESSIDFKLRQLNLGVKVSEALIDLNASVSSARRSLPVSFLPFVGVACKGFNHTELLINRRTHGLTD